MNALGAGANPDTNASPDHDEHGIMPLALLWMILAIHSTHNRNLPTTHNSEPVTKTVLNEAVEWPFRTAGIDL